jgi:PAS domain S-box-containing protein
MKKNLYSRFIRKLRRSRLLFTIIFSIALFTPVWQWIIVPDIEHDPSNLNYFTEFTAHEQVFDENAGAYTKDSTQSGSLAYKIVSTGNHVEIIRASLKSTNKEGELHSSVEHLYGIDAETGEHVPGYGDKDRTGFLLTPFHVNEESYATWDITYDIPITMTFLNKEDVSGLITNIYESHFTINNPTEETTTDNARSIWVEPLSGQIIKFTNVSTIYHYDPVSNTRLNPWKEISEESTLNSVSIQIQNAREKIIGIYLMEMVTMLLVGILLLLIIRFILEETWKGSPYFLSLTVLFIFLGTTYFLWFFSSKVLDAQSNSKFQTDSNSMESAIMHRLDVYSNALQGAKGLFAASDFVSSSEWHTYSSMLKMFHYFPGIEGIAYESLDQTVIYHEAVQDKDPDIFEKNIYSKEIDSMNQARDSGEAILSGKVTFTEDTDEISKTGVFITVPVYTNGVSTKTVEERRAALKGFIYVPIIMEEWMQSTLNELTLNQKYNINIEIYDGSQTSPFEEEDLLYNGNSEVNESSEFYKNDIVDIFGRQWTFHFESLPGYSNNILDKLLPTLILIIGIILSFLVAASIYSWNLLQIRAQKIAKTITNDLEKEKKRLAMTSAKDEALLKSIADGVIVLDKRGTILFMNKVVAHMLREDETKLLGKKMLKATTMSDERGNLIPEKQRPLYKAIHSKKIISSNLRETIYFQRKDGNRFPVAFTISPVFLKGKLIGIIAILRDITQEHEIDKAKTEFVSLASHQLRTPLTAIKWYTEALLSRDKGPLQKGQKEYLEQIQSGNERMVKLVEALLDASRLEMGTLTIKKKHIDLEVLIKNVLEDFQAETKKKKLKIRTQIQRNFPILNADLGRIRMILQNLLSNAIKYTSQKGHIDIKLSFNKKAAQLIISDTGCGIPKEQQGKLFTKLFRADNAQKKDTDGTGLGLYIVKAIVEEMKGKIYFKSIEDGGSTFTVELPLPHGANQKTGKRT